MTHCTVGFGFEPEEPAEPGREPDDPRDPAESGRESLDRDLDPERDPEPGREPNPPAGKLRIDPAEAGGVAFGLLLPGDV